MIDYSYKIKKWEVSHAIFFDASKPLISLPKSNIFIPQINIDIIQNTKNIERNVLTNIIENFREPE